MNGDSLENSLSAPFKCALTSCNELISSSTLLVHFVKTHQRGDSSVEVKEIEENEKITLAVNSDYLKHDKNVCLGILAYNLEDMKHSNALLPRDLAHIDRHMPILIMACRGNHLKMFDEEINFIDLDVDFITIWLSMPETCSNRKLIATLTVHDEDFKKSLSTLVNVRNAKDSQEIREFMQKETDFLTIESGFLKQISSDGGFYLEILISENFM